MSSPRSAALPVDVPVSSSVEAWAVAAKIAVDLVARGRIRPARNPVGGAGWAAGPFDLADRNRLAELAVALPVEAFAVVASGVGPGPIRVPAPEAAVEEFVNAVADCLVRTSAAGLDGGELFGGRAAATVPGAEVAEWLDSLGEGVGGGAIPGLRITLPDGPDGRFEAVVQLRSQLDSSLVVDATELWSAPAVVLDRLGANAETDLLLGLRRLAKAWSPVAPLLDQPCPEALDLTDDDAMDLLGPAAAMVASTGVEVLWPAELGAQEVQLRAVVGSPSPAVVTEAGLTMDTLVEVRLEATIDGRVLTTAELDALAEAKRPMVRLRGKFVLADPALIERLRRGGVRRVGAATALAAALAGTIGDSERDGPGEVCGAVGVLGGARCRRSQPGGAPARAARATRVGVHPPALPAPRFGLDGRPGRPRSRRVPGRRHGSRQDHPGVGVAPAPPSPPRT